MPPYYQQFMPPFNNMPNPAITIHTNASLAVWEITNRISPSRGLWHMAELDHFNVLELKAIEIGRCLHLPKKQTLFTCQNYV